MLEPHGHAGLGEHRAHRALGVGGAEAAPRAHAVEKFLGHAADGFFFTEIDGGEAGGGESANVAAKHGERGGLAEAARLHGGAHATGRAPVNADIDAQRLRRDRGIDGQRIIITQARVGRGRRGQRRG